MGCVGRMSVSGSAGLCACVRVSVLRAGGMYNLKLVMCPG